MNKKLSVLAYIFLALAIASDIVWFLISDGTSTIGPRFFDIASLLFVIGSGLYAKSKGFSVLLALLGLLNIAGFLILALGIAYTKEARKGEPVNTTPIKDRRISNFFIGLGLLLELLYLVVLRQQGGEDLILSQITLGGGIVSITVGCWYYATSKGYSGFYGLLGLFLNFIGLVILVIMPDKNKIEGKNKEM